eukprot:4870527-Pyramimonas_sp.AAC.1
MWGIIKRREEEEKEEEGIRSLKESVTQKQPATHKGSIDLWPGLALAPRPLQCPPLGSRRRRRTSAERA